MLEQRRRRRQRRGHRCSAELRVGLLQLQEAPGPVTDVEQGAPAGRPQGETEDRILPGRGGPQALDADLQCLSG